MRNWKCKQEQKYVTDIVKSESTVQKEREKRGKEKNKLSRLSG